MDLIDRYLQAVEPLLPRAERADILRELSENILSQLQDKEAELGRPLQESEQAAVLKTHGNPLLVAIRYRRAPMQQLIGPAIFPFYWFAVKTLFWIAVAVSTLNAVALLASGEPARQLLGGLLTFAHVALPVFGWVTLLFAVLDFLEGRLHLLPKLDREWDPLTLPKLKRPPEVRRSESVFGLTFGAVYLIWLLAAPYYPYLIFGPVASVLRLSPAWHRFYLPVLLLAVVGLIQAGVNLARPDWTWLRASMRFASSAVGLAIVSGLLKIYPFVTVAADAGASTTRNETVAAIVNAVVLVNLVCFEIAFSIGVLWHGFQLMKEVWLFRGGRRGAVASRTVERL
jgi:hypothetical protein